METIADGSRVVPFPVPRRRRAAGASARNKSVLARGANAGRIRALKEDLLELMSVLEAGPGTRPRE